MQSICLDKFGGEKAVDLDSRLTTLICHIFGGYLQSQVAIMCLTSWNSQCLQFDLFQIRLLIQLFIKYTCFVHFVLLLLQVICTQCHQVSNRYEHMLDLNVEIHGDVASLEDALDQFTGHEWLDGDNKYYCDGYGNISSHHYFCTFALCNVGILIVRVILL